MKTHARIAVVAAFCAALAADVAAQAPMGQPAAVRPAPLRSTPVTYTGTVIQIDYAARVVTTRGPDGQVTSFEAPPTMPPAQLSAIRAGDVVSVTFFEGVSIRRKPAGEPPIDTSADPSTGLRTATATIVVLDPVARTVTFVGPRGRYTRAVGEGADPAQLAAVNVGERADVTYYEHVQSMNLIGSGAMAGTVVPAPPAAPQPLPPVAPPPPDSLRHRLTFSALFGWDNQFSGKLIAAGTGSVNGLPITFDETTYDDVYGRMGLLKVGIGYRVTPRSEVTANFVWSDSASTPVVVGRVGAGNAPVTAAFDDYAYWGVELGQRFYFTRVRFTPFVGYYAGINRFKDLNGDFYVAGNEALLNIQDGEFFDAAWAFSFGPTGGILIGVGPFEVMAQVELRYMGGLSDVDPLSVAGLKNINEESSRWSVPFLFGARIRF